MTTQTGYPSNKGKDGLFVLFDTYCSSRLFVGGRYQVTKCYLSIGGHLPTIFESGWVEGTRKSLKQNKILNLLCPGNTGKT